MESYCKLRNVQERMADGSTRQHSNRDLGRTLTDSVRIIGDYVPITAKDKSRIHQIGSRKGFSGFVVRAGGR